MRELGLRVDVCNRRALEQGVPAILAILARAGLRASFFVTFGPDRSGLAIRRLFQRGFASKLIRTHALRLYGLRTLLSGTLLPAQPVGEAFPEQLRAIEAAGHECGIHGWDHAGWQNAVPRMSPSEIRERYRRASDAFERTLGHRPIATAAPGWQCSAESLGIAEELGFAYASDCRGQLPFRPLVNGRTLQLLQVPTTLPTSDELLGPLDASELPEYYLARITPGAPHVLTVHAESEGLVYSAWLAEFLERAQGSGIAFRTLAELARAHATRAPARTIGRRVIPGRAGAVACAEEI